MANDIERDIERFQKKIATAETTIALYIEQMDEYKAALKRFDIAAESLGEALHEMKATIDKLRRQEERELRRVGRILTAIEKETDR